MLLAALLTIAGILAGLVFLFSDRAQQLHPAAPTVIPLWKLYSYIKEAKKRSIGFMELMRERFGGIIAIKVPFWRHIAILTGPQYAKSFFFSKEADINEGYQVKSLFILFSNSRLIAFFYYQLFHKLVSPDAVRHNPQMVDVFKKAFSKDRLAHLQKDLQAEIQKYLVSHWSKDEQTIDLFAEIEKLSLIIFIKYADAHITITT
jgi:cytochrome P450